MENPVEFSLMGLAELLKAHGFRVTSGGEVKGKPFLRRDTAYGSTCFQVCKIQLTVALEKETADGRLPPAEESAPPQRG
jgi:hypothetical protein